MNGLHSGTPFPKMTVGGGMPSTYPASHFSFPECGPRETTLKRQRACIENTRLFLWLVTVLNQRSLRVSNLM